jgi:hypothetical protein
MFSTLATLHWRAMLKYVAIRMSVMVCYCYVFTANAQSPPVDSAKIKTVQTPSDSARNTPTALPADTTKNKSSGQPADSAKNKPTDAPADSVKNKSADPPADSTKNTSADTPSDSTKNKSVDSPADSTKNKPGGPGADSTGNKLSASAVEVPGGANAIEDSSQISKIEDCDIPFEMAYKIKHMKYSELDSMRIEFQKIIKEDEEEKIITIKMRFVNDHIVGYMTKAPIHHSNKYIIINMPINVKIEWCCIPDSTHPTKHCVATRAELIHIDTTEHCKGWIQSDDGSEMVKKLSEAKLPKDKTLQKKKRFFGRLTDGIVNFFKFKRKKKYILIPIDKTFKELLKPPAPPASPEQPA